MLLASNWHLPFWDIVAGDQCCYNLGSCTYYLLLYYVALNKLNPLQEEIIELK